MSRFTLISSCQGLAYELFYANKRLARKYEKETGHESILIQTDWDFPSLARSLGWNMKSRNCDHDSTDGTVTCRSCGKTATHFISKAQDWLDRHEGHSFNDKYGSIEEAYFS